jgi:Lipase (class 3).
MKISFNSAHPMSRPLKILARMLLLGVLLLGASACGGSSGGSDDEVEGGPPSLESIDLNAAQQMAYLCLQSYQMLIDFNNGTPFTLPAPYTLVKVFSTNEPFAGEGFGATQVPIALIATQGSTLYLVFRGTQTISEWIDDAKLTQDPYTFVAQGGLTETGFTQVYASIQPDILATLKAQLQSGGFTQVFVTGHSLGAALAVLAIPDIKANGGFADPVMYNFAGPRVGNPKFAEQTYNGGSFTSWRVVNTNDIVPTLPKTVTVIFVNNQPKTFFYEHVATEFDLTFGNPITGPTDFTDIEFNHSICNYYATLCGQAQDPAACKAQGNGVGGCQF